VCFTTLHDADSGSGGRYETALQAASAVGNIDVVELLVNKGADVTVEGECLQVKNNHALTPSTGGEYGTAIRAASRNGHLKIALLLYEKGANPGAYLLQKCQPAHLICVKTFSRISGQPLATSENL